MRREGDKEIRGVRERDKGKLRDKEIGGYEYKRRGKGGKIKRERIEKQNREDRVNMKVRRGNELGEEWSNDVEEREREVGYGGRGEE